MNIETIEFTEQLLQLDYPSKITGHLYTADEVQMALDKLDGREIPVGFVDHWKGTDSGLTGIPKWDNWGRLDIEKVAGMAKNFRIEDGYLVADIRLLKTDMGKIASPFHKDELLRYSPVSTAHIELHTFDRIPVVKDMTILGVGIHDKNQDPEGREIVKFIGCEDETHDETSERDA